MARDERAFIHRELLPTGLSELVAGAMQEAGFAPMGDAAAEGPPYRSAAAPEWSMRFESDPLHHPRAMGTVQVLREGSGSVLVVIRFGFWGWLHRDTAVVAGMALCCLALYFAKPPLVVPVLACATVAYLVLLRAITWGRMTRPQVRSAVLGSLARAIDWRIEADRAVRTGHPRVPVAEVPSTAELDAPEDAAPLVLPKRG